MSDFDKRKSELEEKTQEKLSDIIQRNNTEMRDQIFDLDNRLTNINFLTNGGGAVAVLAFIDTNSVSILLEISLILFTIGVVATGFELRAMLVQFGELSKYKRQRNREYNENLITVRELLIIPEKIGRKSMWINHIAGWVSQLSFILGVVVGALSFLCAGPNI